MPAIHIGHTARQPRPSPATHRGNGLDIWIYQNEQRHGPYAEPSLREWLAQGRVLPTTLAWQPGMQDWTPLSALLGLAPAPPPLPQAAIAPPPYPRAAVDAAANTIRSIANYEKCSGIVWLIIGILQCLTLIAIIAGVWNIIAGISRIRSVPLILQRHPGIPAAFEGVGQLIAIGLINLFLGGVIGVVAVIFDFFIRDLVLKNRALFDGGEPVRAHA